MGIWEQVWVPSWNADWVKRETTLTRGSQAVTSGVSIVHPIAFGHKFIFEIILDLWESCRIAQRIPKTLHHLPQVSIFLLHLFSCLEAVTWGCREQSAELEGPTHSGMSCPDAESWGILKGNFKSSFSRNSLVLTCYITSKEKLWPS